MTDKSTKPPSAGRYRLRTFGTLAFAGADGDTVPEQDGHQRRRMALLAVLAAAGEQGRSRDQLLLLFWPDASQSQARHSLEQLLYTIRASMSKAVFSGVNPLRLNPDVVTSDVAEFRSAVQGGDLEAAVNEYRGRFLDGFYLSDSPEFEQWLDAERAQLERSYCGALEQLARSADASRQYAPAVGWWRRLADTDPVSGRNAAGLMRALMNAGDDAAALQYAERYEALVQRELGTSAGTEVANIVTEARARTKKSAKTAATQSSSSEPDVATEPIRSHAATFGQRNTRRSWTRRSSLYTVAAAVIVALILTAAWLRATPHRSVSPAGAEPSIAVLPFANVGGDSRNTVFVDGLSEELIAALASVRNLRVIGRTSALAFRNSNLGARRIADSLGVANLVEGSVQRDGAQLRVQVRLVSARDGSTRWSNTYNRELKDIFSLQSDIAAAVARELDVRFSTATARIAHGSTRNVAAYELYLRGNDQVLLRSASGVRQGIDYFRQTLALDSNYADAYAGLARLLLRSGWDDTATSRRDQLALAEQIALRAVAIDDSSGEAHAALGLVRRNDYQFAGAESQLKRAVVLEPANAQFHEWLAQLYVLTERPAEALVEARRALALDPLAAAANGEIARALLASDRCDEALALLEKLESLRPPLLRAVGVAAQCYARRQMWPQAIAVTQRQTANREPNLEAFSGYLLGRAGRTKEARSILETTLARSAKTEGYAYNVATIYAGLGENDQAFKWLDKALDDRSIDFNFLSTVLDGLGGDPRLQDFRRRLGLKNR